MTDKEIHWSFAKIWIAIAILALLQMCDRNPDIIINGGESWTTKPESSKSLSI